MHLKKVIILEASSYLKMDSNTVRNLELTETEIREFIKMQAANRTPGDGVDNDWVSRGPDNVGGRTRAIMFDPNDASALIYEMDWFLFSVSWKENIPNV